MTIAIDKVDEIVIIYIEAKESIHLLNVFLSLARFEVLHDLTRTYLTLEMMPLREMGLQLKLPS